jgi:DNA mismatch endonuclease, patch repair protein
MPKSLPPHPEKSETAESARRLDLVSFFLGICFSASSRGKWIEDIKGAGWKFSISERYIFEMVDRMSSEQRSRNMAAIRSKHTKPELVVRKLVFSMGYRYRLHVAGLPGTPDLVFPSRRKIIEVRGCFWHRHACRVGRRIPQSNREYWIAKIKRNKWRDQVNQSRLIKLGWSVLTVWECEARDVDRVRARLSRFLSAGV